jgi:dihydropteroate synthase
MEKNNELMTINCKGQLIDLTTPKVMGILNVTPNSFFLMVESTIMRYLLKLAK